MDDPDESVFDPRVEDSAWLAPARGRGRNRGRMPSLPEAYRFLDDHYAADLDAGVEDADIARSSGLPVSVVVRWRREHRGVRRAAHPAKKAAALKALELLGHDHGDVMHRTDASPVDGRWEVPEYVLRRPLDYTAFVTACWALWRKVGMTPRRVAAALGVRVEDVNAALLLMSDRLRSRRRTCWLCDDPVMTPGYCSALCERLALRLQAGDFEDWFEERNDDDDDAD